MTGDSHDPPVRLRDDPEGSALLREGLAQMGATEVPPLARERLARTLGLGPPVAGGGGTSLAAKVGIGLGVLVGAAAILWWMRQPPPAAPVVVAESPSVVEPVVSPPVPSAPPVLAPPMESVAPARIAHVASAAPLPDEATLFRSAGAALRDGDPKRALELIDQQASRFPDGTFVQEREVLRIDALVALGRNDEARDHARAFLAQHPESAHRPRLERMLAQ